MKFNTPEGATPLEPEELAELIPKHITTQSELNEWEQANIIKALSWLSNHRQKILSEAFIKKLHKEMYGDTWKWAGQFRKSNKNIGVDWHTIHIELKKLLADIEVQITHKSYPAKEIAARFHHRLVAIHCFPNGNGRHARLACNTLLKELNLSEFSWGSCSLIDDNQTRKAYINALRAADQHDYQPLLDFVES